MRTDKYFLTSLQRRTKIVIITQNEDKEKELCFFYVAAQITKKQKNFKRKLFFLD